MIRSSIVHPAQFTLIRATFPTRSFGTAGGSSGICWYNPANHNLKFPFDWNNLINGTGITPHMYTGDSLTMTGVLFQPPATLSVSLIPVDATCADMSTIRTWIYTFGETLITRIGFISGDSAQSSTPLRSNGIRMQVDTSNLAAFSYTVPNPFIIMVSSA